MSKTKHWQKIIDDYRASGLTQKAFCQNQSIKIHTLHYWLKKLSENPESPTGFIPFQSVEEKSSVTIQIGHVNITLSISEVGLLPWSVDLLKS